MIKISNCFSFSEVIEKYKGKIQGLDKDLKDILKQESEEKEVGDSQTYNKNLREQSHSQKFPSTPEPKIDTFLKSDGVVFKF